MHSYVRFEDGTYTVGQWLPNHAGVTSFHKLFDVENRRQAIVAVNVMNGGTGSGELFKITKEH